MSTQRDPFDPALDTDNTLDARILPDDTELGDQDAGSQYAADPDDQSEGDLSEREYPDEEDFADLDQRANSDAAGSGI